MEIFSSILALGERAAALFSQIAQEAVRENGRFSIALTGGSSPVPLYQLLAQAPYRELVPWAQTYVFWGDERWVPLTDKRSNARLAYDTFLQEVPVPRNQIYPMWGELPPETFARQYEELLRQHFTPEAARFDLILLGLGDDGHTASLFPGTAVLQEQTRWVQAYYLPSQQMYRITLTAPCLNQAKKILFQIFGEKKAAALYEVYAGARNPVQYPAKLIHPTAGEVIWLVDDKAARRLNPPGQTE